MTDLKLYFQHVDEASTWIKSRVAIAPQVAVVLSGGLESFTDALVEKQEVRSAEIPHFPQARAEGHAGKLIFGKYFDVPIVAMAGRFHYYEGHSPQAIVFPHFVFAKLGVSTLITTNAVGGVNKDFKAGDIMLVEDHINMMGINPLIGLAISRPTSQFTSLTNAYDEDLRVAALRVAEKLKVDLKKGVFMATSGPSYETKAETRAFRNMGVDAVGMSTVPEIIAANFLGMRCCSFSCIANAAADLHGGTMAHSEVLAAMNTMAPKIASLLGSLIKELSYI